MHQSHKAVRSMVEGAVFVAIAEVLGFFPKLWQMPYGGSVTLMMLPIIIYALRWGLGRGLLAGFVLGILDFMLNGGVSIGWQSILGDYMAAITALGLAGLGRGKGLPGIVLGSVLGCLGRFVSIWITGATLWGEFMFDIYGLPMDNEFVYSFLYNLPVLISGVLTAAVCVLLYNIRPLRTYLLGEDIA